MTYWTHLSRTNTLAWGLVGATCLFAQQAQAWEPTEEVEIIIHSSPTSSTNFFVRAVEAELDEMLPHGAEAVNMTGAGGDRARRYVIENHGDPHIIMGFTPSNINNPILHGAEYGVEDFTPLVMMVVDPIMVCVNAASEYQTLDDLIEAARQNPGGVVQGGGDVGEVDSLHHVLLSEEAGVQMTFTPFESKGVVELLGGHVDFIMVNPAQCNPYVESGDFRVLATSEKLEAHADVPTFDEAGYPIRILEQYRGFWMPGGVDQEVRDYYTEQLLKVAETDSFREFVDQNDQLVKIVTGDELDALLAEEQELYRSLDEALGLIGN